MTTYYPVTSSQAAAFSFQPTLDGNQYQVTVTWNLYGQRSYVNVTQLDGTPVVTLPVLESPSALALASLSWANGTVTTVTQQPHGYRIGSTVAVTIKNCAPSTYNGAVLAYVIDNETLTYPLTGNPGMVTALGAVDWFVNMVDGYFEISTLVFRNSQFEVDP